MTFPDLLKSVHAEEVIERAAIMQYDAGLNRIESEKKAAARLTIKYGIINRSRTSEPVADKNNFGTFPE